MNTPSSNQAKAEKLVSAMLELHNAIGVQLPPTIAKQYGRPYHAGSSKMFETEIVHHPHHPSPSYSPVGETHYASDVPAKRVLNFQKGNGNSASSGHSSGYEIVEGSGPSSSSSFPPIPPRPRQGGETNISQQYPPVDVGSAEVFEPGAGLPSEASAAELSAHIPPELLPPDDIMSSQRKYPDPEAFYQHQEGVFERSVREASRNKKIGAGILGGAALGLLAYGGYKMYKKYRTGKNNKKGGSSSSSLEATASPAAAPSIAPASGGGGAQEVGQQYPGGGPTASSAGPSPGVAAEEEAHSVLPSIGSTSLVGGGDGNSNRPLVQQIHDANSIAEMEEVSSSSPQPQQEKATGPDTNRTDPITPATGAKQTTDTANSVVGPSIVRDMAAKKIAKDGPESVFGNARERANMGKGAYDAHSFSGPYDYPIYPGGKPDDTLTGMGAWRTRNGHSSSLWFSRKTAKGGDAKRNKYFKWSTKGGGNWRKLNKEEMMNVFQKPTRLEGGNFYGVVSGVKFRDLIHNQLAEKEKDIAMGKVGARKAEDAKMGWVDGQKRGAKKRRLMGYDGSAHQ